ncbi:uncharacterized protein LOC134527593 [Bacillus rossius redtenbacheri]|uniref:uncharacterized protein LOC134527593 n=1 Tax=Bacillus rossius redtenbacheri TaxID=93214 RepID=UPI002FDD6E57
MNIIYNDYKKGMDDTGESAVSFNVFRNSFKSFNLAFHKPKKDKCGLCESIKNKTASGDMNATDRESYLTYMNEKYATYAEYKEDTKETKENASLIVASFDLQRVLTTPHSDSTLMYYARKYAFYNLTVYENRNGRGTCYVWGECDGRKGSTEISTCVSLWLQDIDKELGEHQQLDIVLYCDNCPGQNKNRCMFSMLYHNCQKLPGVRSIQLKFLLTGHTYMGAHTVHSTIATFIKKRTIMAPSQWPFVIEMARTNPSPLLVRKLEYSDFEDWESLQDNYFPKTLDCEGNRIRWSALREIKFTKGYKCAEIWYSSYTKDISRTDMLKRRSFDQIQVYRAYSKKRLISEAKFKDLMNLCKKMVIPKNFHEEYSSLPHSVQEHDHLDESDEEDGTQE